MSFIHSLIFGTKYLTILSFSNSFFASTQLFWGEGGVPVGTTSHSSLCSLSWDGTCCYSTCLAIASPTAVLRYKTAALTAHAQSPIIVCTN